MNKTNYFTLVLLFSFLSAIKGEACTNVIITKGASKDGSVMVSYSADSHQLYGELYFVKGGTHKPGEMLRVYEWDTGKYLGDIPQAPVTYTQIGNMNEHQVIITETTFGGLPLEDTTAQMDYGSLIYITLQRAKSAREAIKIMTDFVAEYGYRSEGESFSIADKDEAWILEMIGKGMNMVNGKNVNKGAVWVAVKIPDGCISAHANQARITNFPLNDPDNCLYSPDVITFARKNGYYKGDDKNFNFSETYAPLDFGAMRGCEARVWAAFNILGGGMIGEKPYTAYEDYAMGYNKTNRLPLYIRPKEKITVKMLADVMRDHYEGTALEMTKDIGAGGNELPYRWRPLTFKVDSLTYTNERAIATQQTGFWMIGQSRDWLPDEIGGVLWFGVDDAATSTLSPIYVGIQKVPECFRVGNGDMMTYSPTSAFWLFNRISNFAYSRYNLIFPEIRAAIDKREHQLLHRMPVIDAAALTFYKRSPDEAREFLTDYSVNTAQEMFNTWVEFERHLLVKYIDGNVKRIGPDGHFLNNGYSKAIPAPPLQPGYSEKWKRAVKEDAGERLRVR